MADYIYTMFGCGCDPECVCMLCELKAADCKHAGCQNCDKITGHLGCQNK